jgi:tripartite-type tricarboxylate transporter receptor subunit TctC
MKKFLFGLLFIISTSLFAGDPIRLIVPNAAGGGVDIAARIVQRSWDGPMVVDNRRGASGKIALDILHSSGDRTIAIMSATQVISTSEDRLKEFKPITKLGARPFVVIVHPSITSLRTKNLRYATTGVNSLQHILLNRLSVTQNLGMLHIPYHGGGQMVGAVVSGEAHIAIGPISLTPSLEAKNMIKILAITSKTRSPNLPNVPTTKEMGIDLTLYAWLGFIAPPGSNQTEAMNRKFKTVMSDPRLIEALRLQDFVVEHTTTTEFKRFLSEEQKRYVRLH